MRARKRVDEAVFDRAVTGRGGSADENGTGPKPLEGRGVIDNYRQLGVQLYKDTCERVGERADELTEAP